jgi:hypothetical protein
MTYLTLPLQPHKIIQTVPSLNTKVISYNGGFEQRVSKWVKPKRKWKCQYNGINIQDKDTLVNFFIGRYGQLEAFYFYDYIKGEQYLVRFANDSITIEHINAHFFNVEFELLEVFDNEA